MNSLDHQRGEVSGKRCFATDDTAESSDETDRRNVLPQIATRARTHGGEHGLARRLEAPNDRVRAAVLVEPLHRRHPADRRELEVDQGDLRTLRIHKAPQRQEICCFDDGEVALPPKEVLDANPEDRERIGDQDFRATHGTPTVSRMPGSL